MLVPKNVHCIDLLASLNAMQMPAAVHFLHKHDELARRFTYTF